MIGIKKKTYTEPKYLLAHYLPWATLIDESVVVQKDTILQRSFAFRGPDLQSSSGASLNALCMQFNQAVKRLGSGWALFFEVQRYGNNYYPVTEISNPAAYLVERERMERFHESGLHFDSCYYLTFAWKPENNTVNNLLYKNKSNRSLTDNCREDIRLFVEKTEELAGILSSHLRIRVLTDDETLSYLHTSVSLDWHELKAPGQRIMLDRLLPDSKLSTGDILKLGDCYIPIITINDFPTTSFPGILDALNYSDLEYRWCTRFISMSKEDAMKVLDNYSRMYYSKRKDWKQFMSESLSQGAGSDRINHGALSAERDVNEAIVELSDDLVGYGYLTTNLMVWDADPRNALAKMNYARQKIQQKGFTCKQEKNNAFQAWLGMMPGNVYANVRRPVINTGNLAHIVPLTGVWSGEQSNTFTKKLTGVDTPHIICSTNAYTSFSLNFNVDDVGHTIITGPTSSGKSTFLELSEVQFLKYPHSRVIIIDKDKSARQLTLACGGKYFEPGTQRLAFQPLRDITTNSGYLFATEFISLLLQLQNMTITPQIEKAITTALNDMRTFPVDKLTLSTFIQSVQHSAIKEALLTYSLQGPYGYIFDANTDTDLDHYWLMFEMAELMQLGAKAITPALYYLFYAIEKLFDGRLTLFVLDEAWLFLEHEFFRKKLREWLKVLRKKNVFVVFATQEVADAAGSPIMSTILQACHTKIYLADNEALTPAMAEIYASFGLTDSEIRTIAGMTKKSDYFYKSPLGSRLFRLDLGPVALALIAGQDHKFLDRMEEDYPPEQYLEQILTSKNMQHYLNGFN